MMFNWFFAENITEVGISWFDFYSIGHICFGIGAFTILSLFYTIPKKRGKTPILSLLGVFIISILLFIGWELLENILFIQIGWKFEGRIDSWPNIITDILMGMVGALGSWGFCHLLFDKNTFWVYYLFGICGFGLWLGVFMIMRANYYI
ncbi:MAG: hypothetical protein KGD73_09350 [Candidatus Lokiarchaeota archaeon]|nr:hypothetical protein [Candidatus Lokiarchaeota archaeon]